MLTDYVLHFPVAAILGFLSGIGVGGGSLLMLWLTLVLGVAHAEARVINLLFFLPCAVIASLFRWKQGSLDLKKILPAILWGCVGAGISALVSTKLDTDILKKLFGALFLVTGIRELLYKPKN